MEIQGMKVQHAAFGSGIIVKQESNYVQVRFEGNEEVKWFVYPDAFENHLKIDEGAAQAIQNDIDQKHARQQQEKQLRFEQLEEQRIERHKELLAERAARLKRNARASGTKPPRKTAAKAAPKAAPTVGSSAL